MWAEAVRRVALSLVLFLALTVPRGGGVWARKAAPGGSTLPGATPDPLAVAVFSLAAILAMAAWFLSAYRTRPSAA